MQINYLWLPSFLYKYLSLTVSDLVILHFFCYGITFQIKKYDNIVKCLLNDTKTTERIISHRYNYLNDG